MPAHYRAISRATVFLSVLTVFSSCSPSPEPSSQDKPGSQQLTGDYLGQPLPGTTPQIFAPGVVTTGRYTRDVAMTPDGSELYFGIMLGGITAIMETHKGADGVWTEPEVAPFSQDSRFFNLEPHITPDGGRFLFLSTRVDNPAPSEMHSWANQDIWVMDRGQDGWGEPYDIGSPVNSDDAEFFPSVTNEGTLYFTRGINDGQESYIYRSQLTDGQYQEPERLGPEVNSTTNQFNAFIAPDESYIIVCTGDRDDTLGGVDYYVSFRSEEDTWIGPFNLGPVINTPGNAEFSPFVSPDGRFFFFMSLRPFDLETLPSVLTAEYVNGFRQLPETGNPGIYWVDAAFIQDLRPEGFQD